MLPRTLNKCLSLCGTMGSTLVCYIGTTVGYPKIMHLSPAEGTI